MDEIRTIVNKFIKGVNTDIAEDLLPNDFLSNGHNIKFTNDDNRQGIVQKQESYIKELDGYGANLKPLAAASLNDVIYIVSYNLQDGTVEYGTYPSADLSDGHASTQPLRNKIKKYAPLPNFKKEPIVILITNSISILDCAGQDLTPILIETNTEENWVIDSYSPELTLLPSTSGISGSYLNINVPNNTTDNQIEYFIKFKADTGNLLTTLNITHNNCSLPIGSFTNNNISENKDSSLQIGLIYTAGTYSTTWEIQFVSGVDFAVITPVIGSNSTLIDITFSGDYEDIGIYRLYDTYYGTELTTLTLQVNPLPIPPITFVTTDSVDTITSTGAILYGTVPTPDGDTTCTATGFEYGIESEVYTTAVSGLPGSGPFTANTGVLLPNTTYYFRGYAELTQQLTYPTDGSDPIYIVTVETGNELTFTTLNS